MPILLWTIAIALIALGLVGVVIPVVPGAILVFAGMVVAAWADGFAHIGWMTITMLGLLAGLSYLLDYVAGMLGVRQFGASQRAMWGAATGTIIGLFFGLPGLVLGPFVGAVLGELSIRRQLRAAGKAGAGAWIGMILGAAMKVALIGVMIGLFVAALLL